MQAGQLRHRVQICTRDIEETPYGKREADPTPKATVHAKVETLSGLELIRARQVASEATHQVTIRYWQGLTRKHKIRWTDPATNEKHEFDINHINDVDQRHREMILTCKEATE